MPRRYIKPGSPCVAWYAHGGGNGRHWDRNAIPANADCRGGVFATRRFPRPSYSPYAKIPPPTAPAAQTRPRGDTLDGYGGAAPLIATQHATSLQRQQGHAAIKGLVRRWGRRVCARNAGGNSCQIFPTFAGGKNLLVWSILTKVVCATWSPPPRSR